MGGFKGKAFLYIVPPEDSMPNQMSWGKRAKSLRRTLSGVKDDYQMLPPVMQVLAELGIDTGPAFFDSMHMTREVT